MSWKSSSYIPADAVVQAVLRQAIEPQIQKAALSLKAQLTITQGEVFLAEASSGTPISIGGEEKQSPLPVTPVRVRLHFRRTFVIGRSLFQGQARWEIGSIRTDINSLIVRGTVRQNGDSLAVESEFLTIVHNAQRWQEP